MSRGLHSQTLGILDDASVSPFYLLKCSFDSGDVLLTDAYRDITNSGETFISVGAYLTFSVIKETAMPLVNQINVQLSGCDTTGIFTNVLNNNFIDRQLRIHMGFLRDNDNVANDPFLIFDGYMDAPVIVEDVDNNTSTVSITGNSIWSDSITKRAGRHTNLEEQQFYFANDLGFEFVSSIPQDIKWGRQ